MTFETTKATRAAAGSGWAWVPTLGVVTVPGIVIPAILWARIAFHFRHPDASPDEYLTISRAISDPVIGEPFARWVTLAAVLLWATYAYMMRMFLAQHPSAPPPHGWRAGAARLSLGLSAVAMTGSCVGMVLLSHFRLDDGEADRAAHMAGSYLFFVSQAAAIFLVAAYHGAIAEARRAAPVRRFFSEHWRIRAGYGITAAAVLYGSLFSVKSMDFGAATEWVISAYVELETVLITAFLLYLFAFCVDVFAFAGGGRRGLR